MYKTWDDMSEAERAEAHERELARLRQMFGETAPTERSSQ